jgi:hypothetical protein
LSEEKPIILQVSLSLQCCLAIFLVEIGAGAGKRAP